MDPNDILYQGMKHKMKLRFEYDHTQLNYNPTKQSLSRVYMSQPDGWTDFRVYNLLGELFI